MFPSNSSHIGINDLISHSDQALFYQHFESNPTSKQETHPPLSFFHSLSPFEDNEIFLDQDHHHDFLFHLAEPEPQVPMMEVSSTKNKAPRRRSTNSKRDRHSKIKTARGLRDRRMRLSLEVAKKFFGLQDMLGFDKASKTVEWLLNQAKVEIKQLEKEKMKKKNHQSCSSSSTSECEGVSSLDEVVVSGNKEQGESEQKVANRRRTNRKRKSAVFTPLSRECREKARERARERTKEKMRNRTTTNREMGQLGSWNPYETGEECGNSLNPSLDVLNEGNKETSSQAKKHLRTVEDMVHHDSFPTISKWGQSMVFNSLTSLQERQFAEFHPSLGKSWETYNNNGI